MKQTWQYHEIFSGHQTWQVSILSGRFEDNFGQNHQKSLVMMTEMVLETSIQYRHMPRLMAREDVIEFSLRESSGTYIIKIPVSQIALSGLTAFWLSCFYLTY
jgi:hypothetical protein